ncbi:MAG: MBL fold metallo-hydrolase [Agromyces sp.]
MKLTKWEHACMVCEVETERLVIDPGAFTSPLEGLTNVRGIVITHEHWDHWTPEQLGRIVALNPNVRVFGTAATADAAREKGVEVPIDVVHAGDSIELGPFRLRFFGGRHAIIHSSIPQIDNVGVMVNDTLYYPGDSFALPGVEVPVLAAPASAPWMKSAETMDFILEVKPRIVIQAHEMVNSQLGNDMMTARMTWCAEQVSGSHRWLAPGESIDL